MKKMIVLALIVSSCSHQKSASHKEIDLYCQDLNILYQKIAVTTSNIANINTTRTAEGGHYKRKIATNCKNGICEIVNDRDVFPMMKHEPKSPDADKNGYVAYPNIDLAAEKYDELKWSRVFETVTANAPVPANFFFKDSRAKDCFAKYPSLKEHKDFSAYLGRETNQF
jgi:flagellar basal-body rod protein FlgC